MFVDTQPELCVLHFVSYSLPDNEKFVSNLSLHFESMACTGEEPALTECEKVPLSASFRDPEPSVHRSDVFVVCRPELLDYSG